MKQSSSDLPHSLDEFQLKSIQNIENYQTMLEATDFSIFKSESIHDFADSLAEYCQFCFDTCCPLETVYVSATKVSSPHLSRLRRKKKRYFKNGQKHRLNHINEQISDEIKRIAPS